MSSFHRGGVGAPFPLAGTAFGLNTYTFVNTNDQVEWIFQAPDDNGTGTITITRLGYRLASVTGTSPVMSISLQGVNSSGNPDGTIKGGGSPASATFTPAGTATWNWVTLANPYTANRGDWLSIVIAYSSGTLNGSNTPLITHSMTRPEVGTPHSIQNVAGVRTGFSGQPIYGFGSAGKAFGMPAQTQTATSLSTPNERALRFIFDQQQVQSYKVSGARLFLVTPAAGKVVNVVLYSGTTALQTVVVPAGTLNTAATRPTEVWFQDATLATLVGGQEYRLSVAPQDAANNVALWQVDFATAADLEALSGGGQTFYLSTRAGGAWTDVLTTRPLVELFVSDWTVPSRGVIG